MGRLRDTALLPNGFDDQADQILHRVVEMVERLPVGLDAGGSLEVGCHILDRRFQTVQTIVQRHEIAFGHNDLAGRHVQRIGPPPGLIGPLAVGTTAKQAGSAGAGGLGHRAVAPGTASTGGYFRHGDDTRSPDHVTGGSP